MGTTSFWTLPPPLLSPGSSERWALEVDWERSLGVLVTNLTTVRVVCFTPNVIMRVKNVGSAAYYSK